MHAIPALLVGLTALVTSAMVHAGFTLWWLSQHHVFRVDAPYDWAGALAVSGTATTIVLIIGLLARRMVAGNPPPAAREKAGRGSVPARFAIPKF